MINGSANLCPLQAFRKVCMAIYLKQEYLHIPLVRPLYMFYKQPEGWSSLKVIFYSHMNMYNV
jgi:hypothetical protein